MLGRSLSRSRRGHGPELPERRQIVNDPTLPEDLAITDLENHDLIERGVLPGRRQGTPLTSLCTRDGQVNHDTVAFSDEFVNLLVVVGKRCPGAFDHGADAFMSLAKGVRAIVSHEVRGVELGDAIDTAPVPDSVREFANQALVVLAHPRTLLQRRRTLTL